MNNPLFTLDTLALGYKTHPVLSAITLSFARAVFTAIRGANGSGKSTLLKTGLGLIPPVAGRIETAEAGGPLIFWGVPPANQL